MSSIMDERVSDEIEALEAILMDDVVIKRVGEEPHIIETVLHPSTGNDVDRQYVCATLVVTLTPGYPDSSPEVTLRNTRGLDDDILTNIHLQICEKLADCRGEPVVFELIELIRDCLTDSNLPSGQCMICLFGFTKGDEFVRTQCYHYFHSHCLAAHLISGRRYYQEDLELLPNWQQVTRTPFKESCPVCRITLTTIEVETLADAPPPMASFTAAPFVLTDEMKELQNKMAKLLAYQMSKGGVIGCGDSGPPPLTITTPEDIENNVCSSQVDVDMREMTRALKRRILTDLLGPPMKERKLATTGSSTDDRMETHPTITLLLGPRLLALHTAALSAASTGAASRGGAGAALRGDPRGPPARRAPHSAPLPAPPPAAPATPFAQN